ncbi:AMP-binding protein [Mameliella alba]|nr:AMP-binding protein [Antarctobacter heliothermus]MBY6145178.1 AMP-binding protein [Mameliella alba]MCA0954926.1 AMP-binding protein [Mameliella alba]
MTISLADYVERNARLYPDLPALTDGDRDFTWRAYHDHCRAMAGALNGLGMTKGQRVAYLGLNTAEGHMLFMAAPLAGLVVVPMNYRLSARELADCLKDCDASLLIADPSFLDLALEALASPETSARLIVTGDAPLPDGALRLEDLLAQDLAPTEARSRDDDTLIIYYSSGTTGKAKGVELTHWNVYSNSMGTITPYDFRPFERQLLVGPMFHAAAGSRAYTNLILPGHLLLMNKFEPRAMLSLIQDRKVQSTQLVPTMIQSILDLPDFDSFDLSSLRQISWGASPATEELLQRVVRAFPHVALNHAYGMTEASPVLTLLGPDYHRADFRDHGKLGSVGRVLSHIDLKICDEAGKELPRGQAGEIVARGPTIMKGYLGQPEQTAAVLKDGWYHTGDAGYLDADNCLWISGRIKDMIISGGENVYPAEVENVLSLHPAVSQVAVIGVPHARWGEAVHAVIIRATGDTTTEAELIEYTRANLAHYKCPRGVTFRTEPMPMSGANKILKRDLRAEYWPAT